MQHLTAEVPGLLEPALVRHQLRDSEVQLERLESLSLMVTSAERARGVRQEGIGLHESMVRLARAGYAPLSTMPFGSYVSPEFDRLGLQVNDYLRRLRRVIDHCQAIESMVIQRDQAEAEREHRQRFPEELTLLEGQREILAALYPDRWLLLHDGAIRAEFDTAQLALAAGEEAKGRDDQGRPLFLVFCHRTRSPP